MSQNKPNKYSKKRQRQNQRWLPVLIALGGLFACWTGIPGFTRQTHPRSCRRSLRRTQPEVDKEKVDLGDMKFNQLAQVSFQLTNVGDQTLRFTKDPYIEVVEGC